MAPRNAASVTGLQQRRDCNAALPMLRTNHELALVGDFLVLTGGAGTGPGDTTVLTARVRYPTAR